MTPFRPRVAPLVTASALALTATGAPVDAENPPMVISGQPYFGSADNYLTTLGEDSSLFVTRGHGDVTGVGAATSALVTSFRKCG